jgi:pimeloyl-ACP methyl ester carboxylesterase
MNDLLFTSSGVRLRRRVQHSGDLNWLLLPGGPGIGSESLHELADTLDVPGCIWMVDLPGDGSNTVPPNATEDPFEHWPNVLVEAATTLQNCVYVGHSTGGMYLLSTPELEANVVGLALLSTAPDASWRSHYIATTQQQPLPKVDAAMAAYEKEPSYARLCDLCVASAEWNFSPAALEVGRDLLGRMPYNRAPLEWSDLNFDNTYFSAWWPSDLPTLILAGDHDRIVGQEGWKDPKFGGANVQRVAIEGAGHFPWIENPSAVRREFVRFAEAILRRRTSVGAG